VFVGKKGSGKTYVAIQMAGLYKRLRPTPFSILVSPNASGDPTWNELVAQWRGRRKNPFMNKHFTRLTTDVKEYLEGICDQQEDSENKQPYLIILDDLQSDHTINQTSILNPVKRMVDSSRHYQTTLMMIYQGVSKILPTMIVNADVIVSKKLSGVESERFRKMFLEDYTKEEFRRVRRQAFIEDYDNLVVDRSNLLHLRLWRNFSIPIKVKEET